MAWLKVDKELISLWLGKDNDRLVWWIDMLTMAGRDGMFTASLTFLCTRWDAGRKRVENFINYLEESGRISRSVENKITTYRITEGTNQGTNRGTDQGTNRGTYECISQSASYDVAGTNRGTDQGTNQGADRGTTINKIIDSKNISLRDKSLRDITTPASTPARTCEEPEADVPSPTKPQRHDWSGLADFFNRTMDESGARIPRVKAITDRRLTAVMARAREYGDASVYEVVTKAARSSFLNGGGGRVFVADFDWIMRPNNFPKVLEGNYDEVFTDINRNNLNYDADSRTDSRVGHDAGYEQRKREARDLVARLLGQDAGASGGYQ